MSIKGFFKTDVATVTKEASIIEAAQIMRDRNVGNVVVVDSKNGAMKPIGLLTDRDITIGCVAKSSEKDFDIKKLKVSELMSGDPVCAKEDEGVLEVAQRMRREAVGRMPIVDNQGYLAGIITSKNILALLNDELSELVSITDAQKQGIGKPAHHRHAKVSSSQPKQTRPM